MPPLKWWARTRMSGTNWESGYPQITTGGNWRYVALTKSVFGRRAHHIRVHGACSLAVRTFCESSVQTVKQSVPRLAGNWSDWPRACLFCKRHLRWSLPEKSSYPSTFGSCLSSLVSSLSFLLVDLHSPFPSSLSSGLNLALCEKALNQKLGLSGWTLD